MNCNYPTLSPNDKALWQPLINFVTSTKERFGLVKSPITIFLAPYSVRISPYGTNDKAQCRNGKAQPITTKTPSKPPAHNHPTVLKRPAK